MSNKVNTIAEVKKVYTIFSDEETRGFLASLKRLQKDCSDAESAKNFEDAESEVKRAEDALINEQKHLKDAQRAANKQSASEEAKQKASEAEKKVRSAEEVLAEAKKAAQKAQQKASEAQKRSSASEKAARALSSLADIMQRKQLRAEDINKDYLLKYLPLRFNEQQQICSVKLVKFEDEAEVKNNYKEDAAKMLVTREDRLFIYNPIFLFTSNTFLTLFCSAADAKRKAEKEVLSAAEKEAKKKEAEEKEAKRIEAMREKIRAYEEKQQKKQ